jgi:hypothetical protein
MDVKAIRYRRYQLVIQSPTERAGRWRVLVWPPSKDPPTIMPMCESEETAIRDARKTVDRILDRAGVVG